MPTHATLESHAIRHPINFASKAFIADKYAQTPRGLFDIKFFFAGSAEASHSGAGTSASRESVQDLVRELIEKEDKNSPLSDGEVVDILKERGIDVARRTVTKYRRILNIPPSRQRVHYWQS